MTTASPLDVVSGSDLLPPLGRSSSLSNPLFKPLSILLVALSLSIGWGIRGDFGHESGAWIPGALAAMAVCILSGRDDWRSRVGYCALFGGLGWGFGGSISYMYPMSFASSGQWESTWYGYGIVCYEGGLWAGLGGAGTALALCMSRDRLTRIFAPLCFVLTSMILFHYLEVPLSEFLKSPSATGADGTWGRHKSPLYWFDADWLPATFALLGVFAYDLWERKFDKAWLLGLFAVVGGVGGWVVQKCLDVAGLTPRLVQALVVPLGDLTYADPKTGEHFTADNLMTNGPQFFMDFPQYVGLWVGVTLGVVIYFILYGKWRNDSGLFVYMAGGWLVAFLLMPVLGSTFLMSIGGFRLMPPRSDDWAGITGVFFGTLLYAVRNGLTPMAYAGSLNFFFGGISFATVHFLRALVWIPGNGDLNGGTVPQPWSHYQGANWHSVLEQSQGFGHGVATAITFGLLWRKLEPQGNSPAVRRWTQVFSVGFVLMMMTYFNVYKNVKEWTSGHHKLVPEMMKAPFFQKIELSADLWFNLAWWAISAALIGAMLVHLRRPLAIVPSSWAGRGQLVYILLLWIMVIADFERSLNGFSEQRLVTEWVIIMNGALATFLVVTLPGPSLQVAVQPPARGFGPLIRNVWLIGLPVAALLMTMEATAIHKIYGGARTVERGAQYRWGPKALWRTAPILKNKKHR
ncbi:MAG: hypothetical protein U0903_06460 [Planctomycetales bacterium]